MGKLADIVNQMIGRSLESAEFTSANPTHINTLIQINEIDNPDIESEVRKIVREETQGGKSIKSGNDSTDEAFNTLQVKQTLDNTKKLKRLDKGNIGDIHRMTSNQYGNIRELANNPASFMMNTMFRKLAKGAGIIGFALLIFEAVKWIISELMKPGRMLDIRFKRDINNEIIAFRQREEQQKIKQRFSSIIITTAPRLRGGQSQALNTLDIAGNRIQAPVNFGQSGVIAPASGQSLSKAQGSKSGMRFQ